MIKERWTERHAATDLLIDDGDDISVSAMDEHTQSVHLSICLSLRPSVLPIAMDLVSTK